MNIFYLDQDISKCVQYHVDSHVRKMILEYTQLLSAAYYQGLGNVWRVYDPVLDSESKGIVKYKCVVRNPNQPEFRIYAKTHYNHPSSIWTRTNINNWLYLYKLAIALCGEFQYRFGNNHKTLDILQNMVPPILPDLPFYQPSQAMPDEYKNVDSITAYRKYYIEAKPHLHAYTKREFPSWLQTSK